MLIEINDWIFDVDIPMNMELSSGQAADHCMCGYCRNFYAAIDKACPRLREFLLQFGLDVEGPDELCTFEPTIYEVTYVINGNLVQKGSQKFYLDSIPVNVLTSEESDLETERPKPYFTMTFGLIELPWMLDEPMDDVVSPANEEGYLDRMWKKLLDRAESDIYS